MVFFLDLFSLIFFSSLFFSFLCIVTKVTTEHQKWPIINHNSIISPFWPAGEKSLVLGRSTLQEQEVGPRSGPYLVVTLATVIITGYLYTQLS